MERGEAFQRAACRRIFCTSIAQPRGRGKCRRGAEASQQGDSPHSGGFRSRVLQVSHGESLLLREREREPFPGRNADCNRRMAERPHSRMCAFPIVQEQVCIRIADLLPRTGEGGHLPGRFSFFKRGKSTEFEFFPQQGILTERAPEGAGSFLRTQERACAIRKTRCLFQGTRFFLIQQESCP